MKNISIEDIVKEMKIKAQELENVKVKIAISGQSGSGKSSMINTIFGEKVASVGSVETTLEIESYKQNGLEFYDLPGCGTSKFPIETYIEDCNLLSFDSFIIVTSNRFYENDEWLINKMVDSGRSVYVVRTKMDESIANEKRDNDLEKEEVYLKVRDNILKSTKGIDIKGIYLISSVDGIKNDFKELLDNIENNLDGIKKERFLMDVTPYSREVLQAKKVAAGKIISYSATVAAANGLNPIIGLDISVDVAILIKLSKKIGDIFGINEKEINYTTTKYGLDGKYVVSGKQFAAKFIAKEGVLLLLKRYSASTASKTIFKLIPFAGQAIAAGIGYKMTFSFGQELLEEAYDLAYKILDEAKNKTSNHFYENETLKY
ncbi:GTPase [Lacinutrix algicola]|uniref:GTPase n=1 Tax=Lacinutrix algicola TaxID=342954 RepID=UPI0006E3981F|nr:GTPase [Lacinutrix algicola]